ncbi:MAG: HEAT repeat domain-containing protein [Myxococcota bacterium]
MILLAMLLGCPRQAAPIDIDAGPPPKVELPDPLVQMVLEAGAGDTDVLVRRAAIGALVRTADEPAGGPWGLRGRYDPNEYVQRAAIEALGTRAVEAESRALLVAIVKAKEVAPWTRGMAAVMLARGAPDESRDALVGIAGTDPNPAVLLAAAMVGDASSRDRLGMWLGNGEVPVELWFFRELGASGIAELASPISRGIVAVEPEVRAAVGGALARLDEGAGRKALAEVVQGDEDLVLDAVDQLWEVPGDAVADALRAARQGGGETTRRVAAMALVARGDGELTAATDALAGSDPDVRAAAARAIGDRLRLEPEAKGASKARVALRAATADAEATVQLAAIPALGRALATPDDRKALFDLLSDESVLVRIAAADALAR